MAKKTAEPNGHSDRLEDSIANLNQSVAALNQTQAIAIQTQAILLGRIAESERLSAERFARIEADFTSILRVLGEHSQLLAEHSRILERLPEAVRDKIGFKAQQ